MLPKNKHRLGKQLQFFKDDQAPNSNYEKKAAGAAFLNSLYGLRTYYCTS